jgi:hypothetical protein
MARRDGGIGFSSELLLAFEIIDVSGSLEPSPLARTAASGSYRAMSNEILFPRRIEIPCCTATILPGASRNSPDLTLSYTTRQCLRPRHFRRGRGLKVKPLANAVPDKRQCN